LLETLVQQRLLTRDMRNQVERVELTHDRLAAVIKERRPKQPPPIRRRGRWLQIVAAILVLIALAAGQTITIAKQHDLENQRNTVKSELDKTRKSLESAEENLEKMHRDCGKSSACSEALHLHEPSVTQSQPPPDGSKKFLPTPLAVEIR
ncbi:MAG TPA: hypothetical protein VII75_00555, partial [Thermoanaerobaculia bacterium]